jgi:hypothetical protein
VRKKNAIRKLRKLVRAAKHAIQQQELTTDGVNWKRGIGDELDSAIRETEKFTRLRGRR